MKMDRWSKTLLNWFVSVGKGYDQIEEIDFEETYARVALMESIKMILAYACSKDIKVYHMDVKSAFFNGE